MLKIYSSIMAVLALTTTIYAGIVPVDTASEVTQALMGRIGFNNWPNKNGAILQYNRTYYTSISQMFNNEHSVEYGYYEMLIYDDDKNVSICAYESCEEAQKKLLEYMMGITNKSYYYKLGELINYDIGDVALMYENESLMIPLMVVKNNYVLKYKISSFNYQQVNSINTVLLALLEQETIVSDIKYSEGASIVNEIIMPSNMFVEWTNEQPCWINIILDNWQNNKVTYLQIIENGEEIWGSGHNGTIVDTILARPIIKDLTQYDSLRIHISSITIYGEIADTTLMLYK